MNDETPAVAMWLALGALVGALIELNRDMHGNAAGVRAHALVAIATALIATVMMPSETIDPHRYVALSRVIRNVLTGIGFLGAAVILHNRGARHVSGLTTAGTVWLTALLGVGL